MTSTLIVMAGLPGAGKSTLASALARARRRALISVDPIEAAMWRSGVERSQPTGLAAYVIAEALAREQLGIGVDVVIDAVNDAEEAREQWTSLAADMGVGLAFVEVFCSDARIHRERLQSRKRDIAGFPEPAWESVTARSEHFRSWSDTRLRLDSVRPLDELVARAEAYIDDVSAPSRLPK